MGVIIIILGQVVIILNQAIIILDQAIIIISHPEAQIIQVLATLDQVLDIAHHQVHHFLEVVVVCRQDQVHQEVVNLVDNF